MSRAIYGMYILTLGTCALGTVQVMNGGPVFSPSKIQGMIGGHGMGGVYTHIKAFGLSHSHNKGKEFCTEGLLG